MEQKPVIPDDAALPIGAELVELLADQEIRALCVFGSVARRHTRTDSDLDLLAVVPGAQEARHLRAEIKTRRPDHAQIRLITLSALERNLNEMTVFASHLAREGKVLNDRDGLVSWLIARYPKDAPVKEDSSSLASQLAIYDELDWCAGHYLFCLADLYAWGRAATMLVLAREAHFEFDRDRVFSRFAEAHPELAAEAEAVRVLRPFWQKVRRHEEVELPFSPTNTLRQTTAARDACREIVRAGL